MNKEEFIIIGIIGIIIIGLTLFFSSFKIVEKKRLDRLEKFEKCAFFAEVTEMINFSVSHCDYDGNLIKNY